MDGEVDKIISRFFLIRGKRARASAGIRQNQTPVASWSAAAMAGAKRKEGSSPTPRAPKGPCGSAISRMTDFDRFRDVEHGRDKIGASWSVQDVTIVRE